MAPTALLITGSLLMATMLTPVDPEQLRNRYGQEALFRFELGVEQAKAACSGARRAWEQSSQRLRMQEALDKGLYFVAGQALGAWQHQVGCR
jgi:hypothetical protein